MKKLKKLYTDMLAYCSMAPDDHGKIFISFDGDNDTPVHIEKRQLVLPIEEQLRNFDPEKMVVFHPLQEHVNRGESEVVKALRYQLNVRINYTTLVVAAGLLDLIGSSAEHRGLSPEQRELLLEVKSGDVTVAARFTELCLKHFAGKGEENKSMPSRFFTNIYLKKAGSFRGEKHSRVGIVQFPFYQFLDDPSLKLKKGDKEIYESLLAFIFPGSLDDAEAYNGFSDNRDAPWLDCLLKTSYNLAQRLNELIDLYEPYIKDADKLRFQDTWVNELENIESYRDEIRRIPVQRGNEGSVEREVQEKPASMPVPSPSPEQRPHWTPSQQQAAQQPYNPMPNVPQVIQQQNQPQPQQGLSYTADGKLDFNSVERSNPMVAAAGFVSTPITEWQRSQQQQMMMQQGMVPMGYPQGYPGVQGVQPGMMQPQMMQPGMMPMVQPGMFNPGMPQAYQDPRFMQDPRFQQQMQPGMGQPQMMGYPPGIRNI